MPYYLYFLTNDFHNVMYVGMTNNLARRHYEHVSGEIRGFTQKYKTHKLVYYEAYDEPGPALAREKQIKNWRRDKKDYLVNILNPGWKDLSEKFNN